MRAETKERWVLLCGQASEEQDPEKLMALVKEIDEILEAKRIRLTGRATDPKAIR
jgi:hypothetical protein